MNIMKGSTYLYTMYNIMYGIRKVTETGHKQQYYRVKDKKAYYTNNVALIVFDTVEEPGLYSFVVGHGMKEFVSIPADDTDAPPLKVDPSVLGIWTEPVNIYVGDNKSTFTYFFYRSLPEGKLIKQEYLDIVYNNIDNKNRYQINDRNTAIRFMGAKYELYLAFAIADSKY